MMMSKEKRIALSVFLGIMASLSNQAVSAQTMSSHELQAMCQLGDDLIPNNRGIIDACRCRPGPGVECQLAVPGAEAPPPVLRHYGLKLADKSLSGDVRKLLITSQNLAVNSDPKQEFCVTIRYDRHRADQSRAASYMNLARTFVSGKGGIPQNMHITRIEPTDLLVGDYIKPSDDAVIYITARRSR